MKIESSNSLFLPWLHFLPPAISKKFCPKMVFGLQKQLEVVTKVSPVKNHQDLECPHLCKIQSICFQLKLAEITAVVCMFLVVLIFCFWCVFLSFAISKHKYSHPKCCQMH